MDLRELDFDYPPEAVARRPALERDRARLLLVPSSGAMAHSSIGELSARFTEGDVLVLNDTWVRPARILGQKESGGRVEVLVLERRPSERGTLWAALVGAARAPRAGALLRLEGGCGVRVAGRDKELFLLEAEGDLEGALARHGRPPLPPYLEREADEADVARYQTTYAVAGEGARASAAAPTAGLHLTPEVLASLEARGVEVLRIALGVGAGTFLPVQHDRVEEHRMHEEPFEISRDVATRLRAARAEGRRVTAVGTTVVRALEAAASPAGRVRALSARTGLFLLPGSPFRVVTRLLTNFHQPRSTLLALVQAFAGATRVREAYALGVASGYRLFSYGDAMLLERAP